jgi:D-arabinose 5-phosphate isomerase GutQ
MLKEFKLDVLKDFDRIVFNEMQQFVSEINEKEYADSANLILGAQEKGNRVHITGIGKPGHVAAYSASLLSSTGTPTYFLHGTEAVHGSCGQLLPGDVVICISNSGETAELKATVAAIKNNGCYIIAITGNRNSWLAKQGDTHLFSGVKEEGDQLNRAPRASILAENYVIQRLSLLLQTYRKVDPVQYIKWHPGGTLGNLRDYEK